MRTFSNIGGVLSFRFRQCVGVQRAAERDVVLRACIISSSILRGSRRPKLRVTLAALEDMVLARTTRDVSPHFETRPRTSAHLQSVLTRIGVAMAHDLLQCGQWKSEVAGLRRRMKLASGFPLK